MGEAVVGCRIAGQLYNFSSIFLRNHTAVGGWQGAAGVELFI